MQEQIPKPEMRTSTMTNNTIKIKTYKEENLTIPEFDWISIFIMISLWTLGTVVVSKLGLQIFPRYNSKSNGFIILLEVLAQLLFIAIVLLIVLGIILF